MGAYHTIDVEAQRKFTLTKHDGWDSVALDRVDEACDAARTADLAAIIMQEGLANICFVTSSMTVQMQKVSSKNWFENMLKLLKSQGDPIPMPICAKMKVFCIF